MLIGDDLSMGGGTLKDQIRLWETRYKEWIAKGAHEVTKDKVGVHPLTNHGWNKSWKDFTEGQGNLITFDEEDACSD